MNNAKITKNREISPVEFVREYLDVLVLGCNCTSLEDAIAVAKMDPDLRESVEDEFGMSVEEVEKICVENNLVFVS